MKARTIQYLGHDGTIVILEAGVPEIIASADRRHQSFDHPSAEQVEHYEVATIPATNWDKAQAILEGLGFILAVVAIVFAIFMYGL